MGPPGRSKTRSKNSATTLSTTSRAAAIRRSRSPHEELMGTVLVNGTPVEIGANERLNVIQVADRAGVEVPRYCWHPALTVVASCRMCLVEAGDMKDGKPVMQPRVVPACQTPAKDGTVIVTNSEKAKAAQ